MSVDLPDVFHVEVDDLAPVTVDSVGPVGPVTIAGIPDTYHIHIEELPKIQIGVDPVEIRPVEVSMRLKEIPSIRGHLPADFSVGFSLLGVELAKIRLCGEAQMITEPYRPNPCEICGPVRGEQSKPTEPARPVGVVTLREG